MSSTIKSLTPEQQAIVERALRVLEENAVYHHESFSSPSAVAEWLKLRMAPLDHEEFYAVWLNTQNQPIAFERMFKCTLSCTSVYPREVVKSALMHNAAAVVIAHNHQSGCTDPSQADKNLTLMLHNCLKMVEVNLIDHIIVAGLQTFSFAENGLI